MIKNRQKLKNNAGRSRKVYVAMSGGVDSSVAAALLKKRGFSIVGVFFKPWSPENKISKSESLNSKQIINSKYQTPNHCQWREDRMDAMRVAAKLGIPFKTWDFSEEYGKEVVEYMIRNYKRGLTPNPDVMCNKEIKFGLFLKKALAEGADFIATGHYCRLRRVNANLQMKTNATNVYRKLLVANNFTQIHLRHLNRFAGSGYKLLTGVDKNKDQSYFLWTLTQEQLKHCLFPIGDYTKPEVRTMAKKFGLPNYDKKDSQGICFIGKMNVKDFLQSRIKPKRGKVVLASTGGIVGGHDGAYYYTIGQRRGLNLGIDSGPYFVVGKNLKKNVIYVDKKRCLNSKFTVSNVNWLHEPDLPLLSRVKIRYRNNSVAARVISGGYPKSVEVLASKLVSDITPGQSAVFYKGQEMVGGGIIVEKSVIY